MDYHESDHLTDKEAVVKRIYDRLITELKKFGQLKIEPKKTSIHLGNCFGFAGVYSRKNYINLEVHLNYKLTSKRVTKVEQASANRFHHTIKLTSETDVDKELLNWLHEAYELKK
jgi:F0F1-type ATP synthase delta subunit